MPLAKDEAVGLVIAALIGGSALGLYGYRALAPAAAPAVTTADAEDPAATQAARDAFAETLEVAFVTDGTDAAVAAHGTTLEIRWFPCSKPMLDRLLRKRRDALTRKVREASGLSIPALQAAGFTEVICDNTRGQRARDDLAPRRRRARPS